MLGLPYPCDAVLMELLLALAPGACQDRVAQLPVADPALVLLHVDGPLLAADARHVIDATACSVRRSRRSVLLSINSDRELLDGIPGLLGQPPHDSPLTCSRCRYSVLSAGNDVGESDRQSMFLCPDVCHNWLYRIVTCQDATGHLDHAALSP